MAFAIAKSSAWSRSHRARPGRAAVGSAQRVRVERRRAARRVRGSAPRSGPPRCRCRPARRDRRLRPHAPDSARPGGARLRRLAGSRARSTAPTRSRPVAAAAAVLRIDHWMVVELACDQRCSVAAGRAACRPEGSTSPTHRAAPRRRQQSNDPCPTRRCVVARAPSADRTNTSRDAIVRRAPRPHVGGHDDDGQMTCTPRDATPRRARSSCRALSELVRAPAEAATLAGREHDHRRVAPSSLIPTCPAHHCWLRRAALSDGSQGWKLERESDSGTFYLRHSPYARSYTARMKDIAELRKSYEKAELDEAASDAEPLKQFESGCCRR